MWMLLIIFVVFEKCQGFEPNIKIWKPTNYFKDKSNQILDLPENCGKVEFSRINQAPIFIDSIKTAKIILPETGKLFLENRTVIEISPTGKDCFHVRQLDFHNFLNPENWKSEVSENPSIPDLEKLPCLYDTIKFPNSEFSGLSTTGISNFDTVSGIEFRNLTIPVMIFEFLKITKLGKTLFFNNDDATELSIARRICLDPTGCSCRRTNNIQCVPRKTPYECHSPVRPLGFCHKICGAYTLFEPTAGFSLDKFRKFLKEEDEEEVYTHVSKIEENKIQIVFAEKKYTGKSPENAKNFYKKLIERSAEFRIRNLEILRISGSQNNGNNVWGLIFICFSFVCCLYAIIFYVFEKRGIEMKILSAPLPMTSTYRARFSTNNDDGEGLIFDGQRGDVIDLDQSAAFDNPLYGKICTNPDIGGGNEDIEKISFSRISKTVMEGEE